ncbi:hypothetical protein JQK88_34680 [Mesorhizobium caraganae]|uniref:hypothetical protein n=1 Tax=Mesorhizobium caraganae TaxID=483206 RepID=UPI00193AD293|nr:hypothetical protein [Mesorhizobium caraganae]MBM2716217.1 hypothetical protein [Mesorhizobium caraganae]
MNQVHSKDMAKKYLNLMNRSRDGLEFCFAVGTVVIAAHEKPIPVVLVRKKGLAGLRTVLERMEYKAPEGLQKPSKFKFLGSGTGRMNEKDVVLARMAKGKFQTAKMQMKMYFKDLRVSLPVMQEAEPLNEEDLNRFEVAAQDNSDDLPENDYQEFAKQNPAGGAEEALSEMIKQTITTSAASIAAHAISLSRQSGLMQTAELGPLTEKIADWLNGMLAATPVEQRENALHNFTCRLLLMLAYDDNRRNLQYVDEAVDADEMQADSPGKSNEAGVGDGTTGIEAVMVDGIDLDSVPRDTLEKEEVVETLFRMTKARAQERQLPYTIEKASSDRIAMIVSSQWPKEEGPVGSRREILERLIAVVEQRLGKDDQLIALLGLKKTDKLEGDFVATIRSIEAKWRASLDAVSVQWEATKSKINEKYDVESLGGTWKPIEDIIVKVNDAVSNQLTTLVEQEAEPGVDVIARGEAIVESVLHDLDGNEFVQLLDNPPAAFAPILVGKTLRDGIGIVGSELKRIKTSLDLAAPAA